MTMTDVASPVAAGGGFEDKFNQFAQGPKKIYAVQERDWAALSKAVNASIDRQQSQGAVARQQLVQTQQPSVKESISNLTRMLLADGIKLFQHVIGQWESGKLTDRQFIIQGVHTKVAQELHPNMQKVYRVLSNTLASMLVNPKLQNLNVSVSQIEFGKITASTLEELCQSEFVGTVAYKLATIVRDKHPLALKKENLCYWTG